MSALAQRVLTVARPGESSGSVRVACLGAGWVAANVILVALGTLIPYPMSCGFLAGIVNGTVLSVVVVAKASERFQAGTTGLLGGLGLSGLRSDGSMIWKAMQGLHELVDRALSGLSLPGSERLHHDIEQETLYILWTTIFVVFASLVAEWVRFAKSAGMICGEGALSTSRLCTPFCIAARQSRAEVSWRRGSCR